jgi:hypothetical protein
MNRDFFFYRAGRSPAATERQPDGSALPGESNPAPAQQTQLTQTQRLYRAFLFGVFGFYLTDTLWGFFDRYSLKGLLFIDTSIYFL